MAKLKGKNKSKTDESEDQKDIDDEVPEDTTTSNEPSTDVSGSKYFDHDMDEYAVNNPEINYRLDHGYGKRRGNLDLYDIFRDFDRDGDGIVDDIDLDDPRWTNNCKKNGYDPLDAYDDGAFRSGRYRGLTDEEWSAREAQHQHNLDELEKKQSELEKAHTDVHDALSSLSSEKESIDKEIKDKVLETEKLRVEFRKKAAERAAEERKAAMEREKAMMEEKKEERKRKAQQIRETEQIEGKAI